jgi:peptidoglycan L-alanyl-D-glutamate endopeptidase CwlK
MGRKLNELDPKVQASAAAAIAECSAAGLELLVTCTYRSGAEQDQLYAQGRTKPGAKVTNARAGQSFHQYRVALDLYPMVNGKPDFSGKSPNWFKIATIFKKHGFEWAYEWKKFKEMPHFQITGGHPLSYYQSGGKL